MLKKLIIVLTLLTLIAAGCTEKDPTTISTSEGDVDIEYSVPEGSENEWCPIGTTWQASSPKTGEMASMEIVGTETVDDIIMCKAEMDTNVEGTIYKVEYWWSEDDEVYKWIYYDAAGNVASKISMKDGGMTMTDGEGNEIDYAGMSGN